MAALRLVARRLGGQRLQAPVALVEEAQRRLLPRLFDGRSRSTSSAAGYEPPTSNGGNQGLAVDKRSRLREIHNKIEELYNLTSEGLAVDKRSCLREIHNKIEELYNLTSEVEKNYFMPFKGLSVNLPRRLESRLREIHDRTEELYNLTAEVQKKYSVPGKEGRQLRWLRYDLSVLVDPRPDDNEWRWLQGKKRLSEYGGYLLSVVAAYFIGDMLANGTKNMPGTKKKRMEQRKSREDYLV